MHGRKSKPLTRPDGPPPRELFAERRLQAAGGALPMDRVLPPKGGVPVHGQSQIPAFLTAQSDGVTLAIKLQPRASKNEIGEPHGPELRIKVTAPPVAAAANEALLRLLADTLDCPRSKVELLRGHTARHKIVKIHGAKPADILLKLAVSNS